MRGIRGIGALLAIVGAAGCGSDDDEKSEGGSAACGAACDVPGNAAELKSFLQAGGYLGFAKESARHPSAGPHFGDALVYLSPKLDASLAAGNTSHPVGSAAVKELFGDGAEVMGYTVWLKSEDGDEGSDHYWYERFDGRTFADGLGESICVGCHGQSDRGFVQSNYPLQ